MASHCMPGADQAFGPQAHCSSLDFTLLFEQSIFSVGPAAVLLLLTPWRAARLRKKAVKTSRRRGVSAKLVVMMSLAVLQLSLLVLWTKNPVQRTKASIPASVLSLIDAVILVALSYAEHVRSVKPSSLITLYLLISIVLDLPQTRTLWLRSANASIAGVFTATLALKAIALLVEARNKRSLLRAPYNLYPPETLSGFIARSFVWWINPLFLLGYRTVLGLEQLFDIDGRISSEALHSNFRSHWSRSSQTGKHPLGWAMCSFLRLQFAMAMLPRVVLIGFKFSQPLLISRVTRILSGDDTDKAIGNALIGAAVLIYLGLAISNAWYNYQLQRTTTMARGLLVTCVFDKVLRINSSSLNGKAAVTLSNRDVSSVTTSIPKVFDGLIAGPLEIVLAVVLLERQVGWICVFPIILSTAAAAWSFWNGGAAAPMMRAWVGAAQERISFTSEILGVIKTFKMLGLTTLLADMIQQYRVMELNLSKPYRMFTAYRNAAGNIPTSLAPFMIFTALTLTNGGVLDATQAFTTLSLIALLTSPISDGVNAIPQLGAALACLDRIQDFLLCKDYAGGDHGNQAEDNAPAGLSAMTASGDGGIELTSAWTKASSTCPLRIDNAAFGYGITARPVITGIDLTFTGSTFTAIVGPVGCGKSTLLKGIIGELLPISGTVSKSSAGVSYCAQNAWLPNQTVRSIILGPSDFDEGWYASVVNACALSLDIAALPDKDLTLIGTRGVSLSGGQRQRVALARAVYARNKLLILDDTLSGLDAFSTRTILDKCFGPGGICRAQKMTVILATHSSRAASRADHVVVQLPNGTLAAQGTFQNVKHHLHRLSEEDEIGALQDEDEKQDDRVTPDILAKSAIQNSLQQDLSRKTGDLSIYGYYVKSMGWFLAIVFLASASGFVFLQKFSIVWLQFWAEADSSGPKNLAMYISVYGLMAILATTTGFLCFWLLLVVITPIASANMHRHLLDAVMRAPYAFLVMHDTGVLLNRFSSDMSVIDRQLAGAIIKTTVYLFAAIAEGALIAAGSKYVAAIVPGVLIALYLIQKFYLRTSRQLRYLELEANAPLATLFVETIDGLSTVRAFGWTSAAKARNHALLDSAQKPYYLLFCIQVWLRLVLDLMTAAIAAIVVSIAMSLRSSTSAASIGVSLVNVLGFNSTLTDLLQAWTELETSLGAVARTRNFAGSTPVEDSDMESPFEPTNNWPHGDITFGHLSAAYGTGLEITPVVKDISLHIRAGEKVGICGRSGSGKSSLLLSLLRMLDTIKGSVSFDDIDTGNVSSTTVRSRLTVIPQESIQLPGTLRFNIDPMNRSSDEEIIGALGKVQLWSSLSDRGTTLDTQMKDVPLSHGQLQLVSVARALLKHSNIVILDEATSSVDSRTEELIMDLLNTQFEGCTVLAVAHRLETLLSFDRIVVLEDGSVVECGAPDELLATDSAFKKMLERSR